MGASLPAFWPRGWLHSSVTWPQVSVELHASLEVLMHCRRRRCGLQCLYRMLVLRHMGTCGHSVVHYLHLAAVQMLVKWHNASRDCGNSAAVTCGHKGA